MAECADETSARSTSESGGRESCIAEDGRQRAACLPKCSRRCQQAMRRSSADGAPSGLRAELLSGSSPIGQSATARMVSGTTATAATITDDGVSRHRPPREHSTTTRPLCATLPLPHSSTTTTWMTAAVAGATPTRTAVTARTDSRAPSVSQQGSIRHKLVHARAHDQCTLPMMRSRQPMSRPSASRVCGALPACIAWLVGSRPSGCVVSQLAQHGVDAAF